MVRAALFVAGLAALADVSPRAEPVQIPVQIGDGRIAVLDVRSSKWIEVDGRKARKAEDSQGIFCDGRYVSWGSAHGAAEAIDVFDVRSRRWGTIAAPPMEPRRYYSAAVQGSRFAIWGGEKAGGYLADGAIFDFGSGKWTKMADSPLTARRICAMAWTGDRIVVWGGGSAARENDGAVYDVKKQAWTKMSVGPIAGREAPTMAAVGKKIFIWGGIDNGERDDGAIYDVAGDTWEKLPDAPIHGRWYAGSAVVGSKVYVLLGWPADKAGNTGASFDMVTRRWQKLPEAPIAARCNPGVAVVQGRLAVWGGFRPQPKDAAILDPATGKWRKVDDIPFVGGDWLLFYR
jgi:hypothetical protein